jgi:hypothetical protein
MQAALIHSPQGQFTSLGRHIISVSLIVILVVVAIVVIQQQIDCCYNRSTVETETLARLLPAEYLRPMLLGYHNLGADILWLRAIQLIGQKAITSNEYEWLYHTLDVITGLDPRYDYAYQVGGIILTHLAQRVDWSNKLLEKGLEATPTVWQIPFYLGFNHFFYLHNPERAAGYIARAAQIPGGPTYLPELATRMYAEAGNPAIALGFLDAMHRQTEDPRIKEQLEVRMKELIIERDLRLLEAAIARYAEREGKTPANLTALVKNGVLHMLPQEPFGGDYRYDPQTGKVTSSTHPERLRVYRPGETRTQ